MSKSRYSRSDFRHTGDPHERATCCEASPTSLDMGCLLQAQEPPQGTQHCPIWLRAPLLQGDWWGSAGLQQGGAQLRVGMRLMEGFAFGISCSALLGCGCKRSLRTRVRLFVPRISRSSPLRPMWNSRNMA